MEKRYFVSGEGENKLVEFFLLDHPDPSIAELLKIVQKEFPEIELRDLVLSSGDEEFTVKKRKNG